MRQGLTRRHAAPVRADRTAEEATETIDRTARLGQEDFELVEAFAMLPVHRIEPGVEAGERIAMAWQDQKIIG